MGRDRKLPRGAGRRAGRQRSAEPQIAERRSDRDIERARLSKRRPLRFVQRTRNNQRRAAPHGRQVDAETGGERQTVEPPAHAFEHGVEPSPAARYAHHAVRQADAAERRKSSDRGDGVVRAEASARRRTIEVQRDGRREEGHMRRRDPAQHEFNRRQVDLRARGRDDVRSRGVIEPGLDNPQTGPRKRAERDRLGRAPGQPEGRSGRCIEARSDTRRGDRPTRRPSRYGRQRDNARPDSGPTHLHSPPQGRAAMPSEGLYRQTVFKGKYAEGVS